MAQALLIATLQTAAGLVLLYVGAEALVRGAARLGVRAGIPPLAVGLTIVAFGTSAPELAVSLSAAIAGNASIALGNVVGSNICNVALILALAAVIRPLAIQARLIRIDTSLMIGCSVLLLVLVADGYLSRIEGIGLFSGLIVYVAFTLRQAHHETGEVVAEFAAAIPDASRQALVDSFLIIAGLLGLIAGGNLLVDGAVVLATGMGISEAVIGLTVVALGTSLPELATSLVAAVRGQRDIAVGNVIGSNIFNILGILGISAAVQPLAVVGVSWIDFGVMATTAIVVLPLMRTGMQLSRLEGALLLTGYVAYLGWLLAM